MEGFYPETDLADGFQKDLLAISIEYKIRYSRAAQIPKTLYHYTDLSGFVGIVESKKLWATNVSYLNDYTEYLHTIKLARSYTERALRGARDEVRRRFYEMLLERLRPDDLKETDFPPIFTFCLSEKRDDLSQWRGYTGGEGGISIGFSTETLLDRADRANFWLTHVTYDEDKKKNWIELYLESTANIFLKHFTEKELNHIDPSIFSSWFAYWRLYSSPLSCVFKDNQFADEKEWRLVLFDFKSPYLAWRFRSKGTILCPYLEFLGSEDGGPVLESIKELMVGPNKNPQLALMGVSAVMRSKRLSVTPDYTKIPYRVVS
jgi:hypothetical protein